jgi:hypothetical protein
MRKFLTSFIFLPIQYTAWSQVRTLDNNLKSLTLTPEGISVKKGNLNIADDNISIGVDALKLNQPGALVGTGNLAIGFEALKNNTFNAASSNLYGIQNVALGYRSMLLNQGGNWNTAVGNQTLILGTNSKNNTAIGYGAGFEILGNENVAIGSNALTLGYYGNKNTVIGANAGMNPGFISNTSDSANVFIGYNAGSVLGPKINKLYISNTNTDSPLIWGDFFESKLAFHGKVGIGTKTPQGNLHIYQNAAMANLILNNSFVGGSSGDGLHLSVGQFSSSLMNRENQILHLGTNSTNIASLHPDAKFGIGLNGFSASSDLHIHKQDFADSELRLTNISSGNTVNDGFTIAMKNGGELEMNYRENPKVVFQTNTNTTPELVLQTNGNLGLGVSTASTKLEVNGFTKLGTDAPAIKVKKLVVQTAGTDAEPNNIVYVPHGLNGAKILGVQVLVEYAPNQYVPHAFTNNPSYEFHFLVNNTNDVELKVKPGNSSSILNKTAKILITYEE